MFQNFLIQNWTLCKKDESKSDSSWKVWFKIWFFFKTPFWEKKVSRKHENVNFYFSVVETDKENDLLEKKTEQNWIFWNQFYFKIWCVVKNSIEIWWVVKSLIEELTSCKNEGFIDRLTRCRTSFQKLINTKKWLNLILFTNFASQYVSSQIVHLGIKISKTTQKS